MNKSKIPSMAELHQAFCERQKKDYDPKNIIKDLEWNCYAVSCVLSDMLRVRGIKSRPVYGMWFGNMFNGRRGPFRHGWVTVGDQIIDATRWVFDGRTPQMYQSKTSSKQYDEGMVRFREQFPRPFPDFVSTQKQYSFDWTEETGAFLKTLTGHDCSNLCAYQVLWLGNVSYLTLGTALDEIYTALEKRDCLGFIPVDFKNYWKSQKAG